jgi:hypothetical protein
MPGRAGHAFNYFLFAYCETVCTTDETGRVLTGEIF